MSDDGERTCPLCAEEMDLTDLQLKPCTCGYEICIWCWHHIIEMAEKDDTESRCPACRTPYDKDKVLKVAAANSERIIAEVYIEKKQRSQRAKHKISAEAMKHLGSVRVMQKNLVYITGLPFNLCDENILDRKEYFGQYGKVLNVSISRPAGTSSQKTSSNNTFGVYITYAREDEAVRCIQAVHNYVLEGKSLRACFGTTKYCRAWLRNMTCSNPDCLYLHDIGSQEDSFTKDEIISAYTRSRVPQIALNNSRRSGNVLPPPMDDFHNKGTGLEKHPVKSACNSASSQVKGSLSNPISGKSNSLPAAASWGLRGSNCRVLTSSMQCSQSLAKQKVETSNNLSLPSLSTTIPKQPLEQQDEVLKTSKIAESNMETGTISGLQFGTQADPQLNLSSETASSGDCSLSSSWNDDPIIASKPEEEIEDLDVSSTRLESLGPNIGSEYPSSSELLIQDVSEITNTSQASSSCLPIPLAVALEDEESGTRLRSSKRKPGNATVLKNHVKPISKSDSDGATHDSTIINGNIQSMGSGFSSDNMDGHMVSVLDIDHHRTTVSNLSSAELPRSRGFNSDPEVASTIESTDWNSESQRQQLIMNGIEDSLMLRNDCSSSSANQHNKTDYSSLTSWCNGIGNQQLPFTNGSLDMDRKLDITICSLSGKESDVNNGSKEDDVSLNCLSRNSSQTPEFNCSSENMRLLGRNDVTNTKTDSYADKMGESSIISDILSLDFDPWDDQASSADTLAKLLDEKEKQEGSLNLSNSLKSATNNQSRFSFARQESLASYIEAPISETSITQRLYSSHDPYQDNFQHELQFNGSDGSRSIASWETSSNVTNGILRTKMTAPPGFTAPSRAPPPGFSSQDRFNPTYEAAYMGTGGNHYQSHSAGSSGDVEFIDPAILAIGKGRVPVEPNNSALGLKSSFPTQFISSDNDPRFNLMSHHSVSSHQNMRMPEHMGERYLPLNDSYIASRLLAQSHPGVSPLAQLSFEQLRNPLFSNGHWDAWNSMRTGNDIGLSEVFRNERFGVNDYYTSTDEYKFRMQSAGNLYNRAFGI